MSSAKKKESSPETELHELQSGFWFNREEDEEFVGSLTTRRVAANNRASKAYAEFLATSTRLSVASFSPVKQDAGFSKRISAIPMTPVAIAHELLPVMAQERLTWLEWGLRRMFTFLTIFFGILAVIFLAVFTLPLSDLNDEQGDCIVVGFSAFTFDCGLESEIDDGFCLQLLVSTPSDNGLSAIGNLQGFDQGFVDINTEEEVSCAVTNCFEDPIASIDRNNLPEPCNATLEDEERDPATLNDVELLGCTLLQTFNECVTIVEDDPFIKKQYFDVQFQQGIAISTPKQPSSSTLILITVPIFVVLLCLMILSFFELRRPLYKLPDTNHTGEGALKPLTYK